MQIKILYIGGRREWLQELDPVEPPTIVETTWFDAGTPHLDYEFYEHIAIHKIIEKTVTAEKEGFDAVVIGCFYDPGLQLVRELVEMPVVGVCEASLHVASMLTAGKFSVLVGSRKNIPQMSANARNYGLESRIASWRTLNIPIPEMRDKERTQAAILREGKIAVEEDLAECIALGCTGMAGQAKRAQEALGVPVLDPALMGIKVAELMAVLWKRFGISHSKIGGHRAPPQDELKPIYERAFKSHL